MPQQRLTSTKCLAKPASELSGLPAGSTQAKAELVRKTPCATASALQQLLKQSSSSLSCDADESDASLDFAEVVDRSINYAVSRLTFGSSPAAVAEAYFDWL